MSLIDVVNNWLVFPLLGISEFHHAYRSSSAIETVKEFTFHLILTINTCHTPNFFFMIIIIYSSTKELILKYSISALKNLNVEFLLEFVQKEDMENLL